MCLKNADGLVWQLATSWIVWSGSTLFVQNCWSFMNSLIRVYSVCPELLVLHELSDQGLLRMSRTVGPSWTVWSGSTLFVQNCWSFMNSLIRVYSVCPALSVLHEQRDQGLLHLSRTVGPSWTVWSGSTPFVLNCRSFMNNLIRVCSVTVWSRSTPFVQNCRSFMNSVIRVYSVCPELSDLHEQSDQGLLRLSRTVGPSWKVWSGSTPFVQNCWSFMNSVIRVYSFCPELAALHEQSDQGLLRLSRTVGPSWTVWSESTLFVQNCRSFMNSVIRVYSVCPELLALHEQSDRVHSVCPELSVLHEQSEHGLLHLSRTVGPSWKVWLESTLFVQNCWSFMNSVIRVYSFSPELLVLHEQCDLALLCLSITVGPSWTVWSGSALFVQNCWSFMNSVIWLYSVCPELLVLHEQCDQGLLCLSGTVGPSWTVWSGSILFVQNCWSFMNNVIRVYSVCPELLVLHEQCDQGLLRLSRTVGPNT